MEGRGVDGEGVGVCSEEVIGCAPGDVWLASAWSWIELQEGVFETVI